ncbi:hypothetical protein HO173_007279 [Letharia columbiana]|uniref:Uncharacterized protein n=1 Tax=Letharia columbiana TaxID=112416 RepID=A0A8H6FTX0_9LECA|nr:uncharacterized protein HO173_007279 [Letharia columbiana]KAF6234653.1 hypothetical protein HO173_007279 [Letharia columbiana]
MRQYIEQHVMKDSKFHEKQRSPEEASTKEKYVLLHELSKPDETPLGVYFVFCSSRLLGEVISGYNSDLR